MNEKNKNTTHKNCFGLDNRLKNEKLSKDQILFLKHLLAEEKFSIKEIQYKYKISTSTLSRIKRSQLSQFFLNSNSRNLIKIDWTQEEKLIKLIRDFIFNVKHTVTAKEITNYIILILDTTYSVKFIRGFIRKKVNLSYKKVKSRPISINMNKIKTIKTYLQLNFPSLFQKKLYSSILMSLLLIGIQSCNIHGDLKEYLLKVKIHYLQDQLIWWWLFY